MPRITHAMSVDVEDYFHVSAFEKIIPQEKWSTHPFRVQASTEKILKLFDDANIKATFFVLGWVAQRCPELVRKIHIQGHEVACHSFNHQRIDTISPAAFRQDCLKSRYLWLALSNKICVYCNSGGAYRNTDVNLSCND